jgi:hypothetical protein
VQGFSAASCSVPAKWVVSAIVAEAGPPVMARAAATATAADQPRTDRRLTRRSSSGDAVGGVGRSIAHLHDRFSGTLVPRLGWVFLLGKESPT